MALAGFGEDDVSIVQRGNELVVGGEAKKETEARMDKGLLQIDLVREVPEALRPRKIEIGKGVADRLLKTAA